MRALRDGRDVAELTGRTLFFSPEVRAGITPAPVTSAEPPSAAEPADPMADFKNDPLIRKALEIFKGEIQTAQASLPAWEFPAGGDMPCVESLPETSKLPAP